MHKAMPVAVATLTTIFSAVGVYFIGGLSLCAAWQCLGSGAFELFYAIVGLAITVLATLTLVFAALLTFAVYRSVPPKKWHLRITSTIAALLLAIGTFQVIVDPGDAPVFGYPLFIWAALLFATSFVARKTI